MIYTTNWIERLNRDYKRVINMRGAMRQKLFEFVQSTVKILSLSIKINIQRYDKFILYLKKIVSETNTDVPLLVSEKLITLLNDSLLVINNQNILSQFTIDICIGLKEIILSRDY